MARKKMNLTEEKIQALVRAGRGQGEGAEYIPWLQIGDFSSQGRSHRIQDHENGRIHHLFSDLEADYYHILAWADTVVDIREQYPLLPVAETERIADTLGIRHPRAPGGGKCNEVMTTDFLLTVCDKTGDIHYEARYVKYASDLKKPRVCEKLKIELREILSVRLLRSIASIGSKLTISVICLDTIHLLSSRRLRFRLKTPQTHC